MDIEIEYIDLQSSNFTQTTIHGVSGDWRIRKNITGEDLQTFPPSVSDVLMYEILTFAKKFELIAFNAGINFQKDKENEVLAARIQEISTLNNELVAENTRLATVIEYITSTSKE
jgi:uncharacterized protein YlxW (UPF0749 family)